MMTNQTIGTAKELEDGKIEVSVDLMKVLSSVHHVNGEACISFILEKTDQKVHSGKIYTCLLRGIAPQHN